MPKKLSKTLWILVAILALIHFAGPNAHAQNITITFSSDPSGISLAGSGTSSASMAFGNIQAYGGAVPAGVTKTLNGTTSWNLSTPLDLLVTLSGLTSANYMLTAQLGSPDPANTWKLGGVTLSSAAPGTITASGSYSTTTPYTLGLTIPFSASAGTISNNINFIVTAN